MSAQSLFDENSYVERLKRGGFSQRQALSSAEALGGALEQAAYPKRDRTEFEAFLRGEMARLDDSAEARAGDLAARLERLERKLSVEFQRLDVGAARVDSRLNALKADLAADLGALKRDAIRWLLVLSVVLGGFFSAALKFAR